MPCILLCSTAFKQGINHECPGSNSPYLPYTYMHALAIWLLASQTIHSPTPAFSSCAPQLFKQVIDHAQWAFCNVIYFTPVIE